MHIRLFDRKTTAKADLAGRSDGYWHGRLTKLFCLPSFVIGLVVFWLIDLSPLLGAGLCAAGCLLGLLIDPDLDQASMITSSEWRAIRLFGPIGAIWVGYWFNYALIFGGFWVKSPLFSHRGISHWPILGTLTRIAWLIPLYCLFDYVFDYFGIVIPFKVLPEHIIIAMIGLMLSDISHALRDFKGWKA